MKSTKDEDQVTKKKKTVSISSSEDIALDQNNAGSKFGRERSMSVDSSSKTKIPVTGDRPKLQWQLSTTVSAARASLMPNIADMYKRMLDDLGEDSERPGLIDTPKRAAQAMLFFTKGYEDR